MSLALTFIIPSIRSVKTRAITDPSQYDTEINTARGFKPVTLGKPKVKHTIRVENGITYDPAQYDTDENVYRHIKPQSGE
jgi:hypothetical protein|tara:strand:- start:537 stop:776 length:240 start_codon:yes stop_codon:yes gene_type:complete